MIGKPKNNPKKEPPQTSGEFETINTEKEKTSESVNLDMEEFLNSDAKINAFNGRLTKSAPKKEMTTEQENKQILENIAKQKELPEKPVGIKPISTEKGPEAKISEKLHKLDLFDDKPREEFPKKIQEEIKLGEKKNRSTPKEEFEKIEEINTQEQAIIDEEKEAKKNAFPETIKEEVSIEETKPTEKAKGLLQKLIGKKIGEKAIPTIDKATPRATSETEKKPQTEQIKPVATPEEEEITEEIVEKTAPPTPKPEEKIKKVEIKEKPKEPEIDVSQLDLSELEKLNDEKEITFAERKAEKQKVLTPEEKVQKGEFVLEPLESGEEEEIDLSGIIDDKKEKTEKIEPKKATETKKTEGKKEEFKDFPNIKPEEVSQTDVEKESINKKEVYMDKEQVQEVTKIIEDVLDKKMNDWMKTNLKDAIEEAIEEALEEKA